mmetsp:Transcript_30732/g.98857  ORF Transcript_30732/g.98857 Transcript_30732/m.98857 type:complete len:509 (-) Transcript_30732:51-1577(-)
MMLHLGCKTLLLFLSLRCAMRGGGLDSDGDFGGTLGVDVDLGDIERELETEASSIQLSQEEQDKEESGRGSKLMDMDESSNMFKEFHRMSNIDVKDSLHYLYQRAVQDRLNMLSVVPGTYVYALCVRMWAACYFGLEDELLAAIRTGAIVDMVDERRTKRFSGWTALHWAAYSGEAKCVNILIRCGARRNVVDDLYRTPLHIAAQRGHVEVVKELLHFFADFSMIDKNHVNAMQIAHLEGHREVVKVIYKHKKQIEDENLRQEVLAHGRKLSSMQNREQAGIFVSPEEKDMWNQTGRRLSERLFSKSAKKRRMAVESNSESSADWIEHEEQTIRAEAKRLIKDGFANNFQQAMEILRKRKIREENEENVKREYEEARSEAERILDKKFEEKPANHSQYPHFPPFISTEVNEKDKELIPLLREELEELVEKSVRWRALNRLSENPFDVQAVLDIRNNPNDPYMGKDLNDWLDKISREGIPGWDVDIPPVDGEETLQKPAEEEGEGVDEI